MGKKDRERLHRRLVHLGDLMGDGEHLEKGGAWIEKEYSRTLYALYPELKPPKKDTSLRDKAVKSWCGSHKCKLCRGHLKQKRKGSMRVICVECRSIYQLKRQE